MRMSTASGLASAFRLRRNGKKLREVAWSASSTRGVTRCRSVYEPRSRGAATEPQRARYGYPNGPAPVASYNPNGYGVYDMVGNVWEWVADWYDRDYYVGAPDCNPIGPDSGKYKMHRGAGWSNNENIPYRSVLGVHYRNYSLPDQLSNVIGFRCAESVKSSDTALK